MFLTSCRMAYVALFCSLAVAVSSGISVADGPDVIAALQESAVKANASNWGYWGPNPKTYSSWKNHSNRLIPVYTFGTTMETVSGEHSVYRSEEKLRQMFGYLPEKTHNPEAQYSDQTDVFRLQSAALESGKQRVILFVCDGMDWQTTRAAAIAKRGAVTYQEGRGEGLSFLDYRGVETDFGYFVSTPQNDGTSVNVDDQIVKTPGGKTRGGYDPRLGGNTPWADASDSAYPIAKSKVMKHAFTDSASSATSMTSGIKTYNAAINVDFAGREVRPLARDLQDDGFSVGVVTSVPISHATPACAYANNVHRGDYQDLTRDLIGRPSSYHPGGLPGVDVLIGGGWGIEREKDGGQGNNFVPGNRYITADDLNAIDVDNGGKYVVAQRTAGKSGTRVLCDAVKQAKETQKRLFGFFGVQNGHLPFRTADGQYDPVISFGNPEPEQAEVYSDADIKENVTLRDMSLAALELLSARGNRWWLMVEAGDVDWANHSNNIDNSIGAVHSGDEAFAGIVQWIEQNGGWSDTVLILTADHGHYFNLVRPEALIQTADH